MYTLNRALLVAATAAAFMLLAVVIATAGERHQTLEEVNREINDYWQQQREEWDRRLDLSYQKRQTEALEAIEQNTEEPIR